jgi:hypothetical protein
MLSIFEKPVVAALQGHNAVTATFDLMQHNTPFLDF